MFKRSLLALCFLMVLPVSACAQEEEAGNAANTASVTTQSVPQQKIAVVDVQQLLIDSKAAVSIKEAANNLREDYQKEIQKIEKELKDEEAEIIKSREGMSQEEFMTKRQEFQKDLLEGQQKVADMNKKLDKAVADSLNEVRDEIIQIVADMSSKEKFDLVISRQDVVIVSKDMDITAQVMDALNKKLPKVKVKG